MIPKDIILYSWLDVEEVLFRSSQEGDLPHWIINVRTYWDSLSLSISRGKRVEALNWLANKFEPRFDQANQCITLESDENLRSLPVLIEDTDEEPFKSRFVPTFSRPSVLARHIEDYISAQDLEDCPHIVAFHSFKGGVGRTVHALGLALALAEKRDIKVLLIDGDLEAPGLTWLFGKRMPKAPVSYMDFLTLVHGDSDPEASNAIKLVANRLRDMLVDGIYIMPAFRSINKFISLDIKPEHLARGSKDPLILTNLLSKLGKELSVDLVIVDLRAGLSEISASLLLDPRVYRVLVTTLSGQSIQGTKLMLDLLGRIAPSKASNQPLPSLIITQVPDEEPDVTLDIRLKELAEAFSNLSMQASGNLKEEPAMVYSETPFDKNLIVLPDSWNDAIRRIRDAKLDEGLMEILDWLPNPQKPVMQLDKRRSHLAEYTDKVVYAETGDITDFLRIRPLTNLISDFNTKVPTAVVIGAKGSGKTLTFLQLAREKEWSIFAGDSNRSSIKAAILPILKPMKLRDAATSIVEAAKNNSAQYLGLSKSCAWEDISYDIRERLSEDSHEGKWRDYWLNYIAWSAGFSVGKEDAGRKFPDYLREKKLHIIAIIDGLETQFPELASDKRQQVAVRSLLQDVPNWLEQQLLRPLGIIIFIRKDMVLNALPQNSAQFVAVYKNYELNWSSEEALRLFAWTSMKAEAIDNHRKRDQLIDLTREELVQMLIPLWGRKLGKENSSEAISANWVIYALSDFNGQIQARDVIRFLHFASKSSKGDTYWDDRVLVPPAIRGSLLPCSQEKVTEIREENNELRRIFEKINEVSIDKKRVPFDQFDLGLEPIDLEILEQNGVIGRDGEKYYVSEIFREGLGFTLGKGARPKVLAMAIRAQRQRKNPT